MGTDHWWTDPAGRARDHAGASHHPTRTPRNRTSSSCGSLRLLRHDRYVFHIQQPGQRGREYLDPATYPSDWEGYRTRWETGHALAALLSVGALGAMLRAWLVERDGEV